MATVTKLDQFGFLLVTGKDAQKFLQGYVTCDLADIDGDTAGMGAVCNLQGRMVTSFRIVAVDGGYLLRMMRERVPATMEFLKKYIVFSKAEMKDASGGIGCFGVTGDVDGYPATKGGVVSPDDQEIIRVDDDARFEVWNTIADWTLPDSDTGDPAEWQAWEIDKGIAWVTGATSEEFIPQMFNYHNLGAIDFDKGCYLGQEIVARMQYRGALGRKLFKCSANASVSIGDSLENGDGKSIGTVVATGRSNFLAVIQSKEDSLPECRLTGGQTATLVPA